MNLSREAKGEIMQGWLRRWRRGKCSFSVLCNSSAAEACDQPRLQGSALPSMGHPRSECRTRGQVAIQTRLHPSCTGFS